MGHRSYIQVHRILCCGCVHSGKKRESGKEKSGSRNSSDSSACFELFLIMLSFNYGNQLINENRILQYFGRISLIILCIHGPVYRIVVKIVSILLNAGIDAVRENFLLAMVVVVITMAICSTAYEVVVRLAPWMVGKKKVKEN